MGLEEIAAREAARFLPVVNRMPVALVSGRGSRVLDVDGAEYVDLTAGWGVTCIGHCHPELVEAISSQAGRLMFCGDTVGLDETGQVSTEFEPEEAAYLPPYLANWAKICTYDFDALVPLHTLAGSPRPYISPGGRAALQTAHEEVSEWLGKLE